MLRHRWALVAVVVAFAAMTLVSVVTNRAISDDPRDVISLQMSFTPERFTAVAAPWGEDGKRDFRRNLFLVDLAFPAIYALLLVMLLARFAPGAPQWAMLAPVAAALADGGENTLHAAALARLLAEDLAPGWAVLGGSLLATVKYLLLIGALLTLARRARPQHALVGNTAVAVAVLIGVAIIVSL